MRAGIGKSFKNLFLNLTLIGVALLIGALLMEVAIRIIAPQQLILLRGDIWQPVDSVGWAHRPDLKTDVNTGDRTVGFFTDQHGFRIASTGRPTGRYRILLLGDSFMAAMQVEDEQSTAGLIERCLAPRVGGAAAVWNTGVSGWDPPQYYVQARRVLDSLPFDLVLVSVFLGNDVVDRRRVLPPRLPDARHDLRFPRRLTRDELVDAILAPINDGLETRSHLFVFMKNRFQSVLMQLGLTHIEIPIELRRDQATSPRWAITGSILADIDSLARAHGAASLFMLIPSIEQVEPEILQNRARSFHIDPATLDIDQPERLIKAELEKHHLRYFSVREALRAAQQRGVTLYGRADMHPSAEGHRVMWNTLAPHIAQALKTPYSDVSPDPACSAP
jgi:hypothetical protein